MKKAELRKCINQYQEINRQIAALEKQKEAVAERIKRHMGDNQEDQIDDFIIRCIFRVIYALTLLVHANSKTTAYFLSLLVLRVAFVESSYSEHIWIVPSHTKCRMGEYKLYRTIERQ